MPAETIGGVQCDYNDAGVCRSCTHMGVPYAEQLAAKQARVEALLGDRPGLTWDEPHASAESGFRTKSTMVVAGTPDAPTLGILDPDGGGVDLRGCGLLGPATAVAMPVLGAFIAEVGLRPYDVPRRSGELKYVHVIEAGDARLLVRFVLRSPGQVARLRRALPRLRELLPGVDVVSVNLLPEHKAVTAGEEEIVLTERSTLAMPVGDVTLHVAPGAFVQTNGAVAAALYRDAGSWIAAARPESVLDLYCGVGGFALHAVAGAARDEGWAPLRVHGVEVSEQAVASARRSAAELATRSGPAGPAQTGQTGQTGQSQRAALVTPVATFEVGDATAYAMVLGEVPELVVVNPPRRGLSRDLAGWLDRSGVRHVVYSSCNPVTLARDLDAMGSLRPVRARLFDMFPQTDHAEVLTLLRRV